MPAPPAVLPPAFSLSKEFIIVSFSPVSYTHLDVYKRQDLILLDEPTNHLDMDSIESVSYTHLDVYKRQESNKEIKQRNIIRLISQIHL